MQISSKQTRLYNKVHTNKLINWIAKMLKSFPSHKGPYVGADLRFHSQTPAEAAIPRTRGQCVAWSACLALSLRRCQFILLGKQRHMYVNNVPRVVTWSGAAETRTCDLMVASPTWPLAIIVFRLGRDSSNNIWVTLYRLLYPKKISDICCSTTVGV